MIRARKKGLYSMSNTDPYLLECKMFLYGLFGGAERECCYYHIAY